MYKKIMDCEIKEARRNNEVHVTYYDGSKEILVDYYPDEITFRSFEFVGLNRFEAMTLARSRYAEYTREIHAPLWNK